MRSSNTDTLMNTQAYVFDVQWVACDPLHGFQQEAGQRHALTPVVCGNFLMETHTHTLFMNLIKVQLCYSSFYLWVILMQ